MQGKRTEAGIVSFAMQVPSFGNGGEIPRRYTCEGENLSPALRWDGVPAGAHSLALIVDDPDAPAGTFTHWLAWNIPTNLGMLQSGMPHKEAVGGGTRQGTNDFGQIGYGGPCPPPGKSHRYFFHFYAIDSIIALKAGASRAELEHAMKHHIVSQTEWMGRFKR